MNLYLRFLILIFKRTFWSKKSSIFSECVTPFRVAPTDLDLNFHMNNGKYLSIMDLGRFDLLLKTKTFYGLALSGHFPVVVSESIRFKKSLAPFQRFDLVTQIESFDDRDFFISQKFRVKEAGKVKTYAVGYMKGRFKKRGRKSSLKTRELFTLVGEKERANQMSDLAGFQNSIEQELFVGEYT